MNKTTTIIIGLILIISLFSIACDKQVKSNSYEGKEIQKVIDFLCDLSQKAKDPKNAKELKKECDNIKNYLKNGKFVIRKLKGKKAWTNNVPTIFLDPSIFLPPSVNKGKGYDPSSNTKFFELIGSLVHEKYHAEVQGRKRMLGGESTNEPPAHLHTIEFLDKILAEILKECDFKIKQADTDINELEKCHRKLNAVLLAKKSKIRAYEENNKKGKWKGKPVPKSDRDDIDKAEKWIKEFIKKLEEERERKEKEKEEAK